jgi:nicotinamidase/pyrazinamidase
MTREDRLNSLLSVWQQQQELGRDISPEELCLSCPELREELRQRIEVLRQMGRLAHAAGQMPSTLGPSTSLGPVPQDRPSPMQIALTAGLPDDPFLRLASVGRCTVSSYVGKGGMGAVYRARHRDLHLDVAVKFLHAHLTQEPKSAERFLREARLAARLQSPAIVRVFDCGEVEGHYYIVMEYVDGQTLAAHLKERGRVPVGRALQIAEAVAAALRDAVLQIKLIHRDVKPANILLTHSGQVKLADLGLAKVVADEATLAVTASGVVLGTPHYMAPEQFIDASRIDHRADIFSLGATLYELLAGQPPFRGSSIFTLSKQIQEDEPDPLPNHVPVMVCDIIARMMAKKPEERYQTYDELIEDLQASQKTLGETGDQGRRASASLPRPSVIPQVRQAGRAQRPATPAENRVLLVVDIQNDFCPNGALAVPKGDEVIPLINQLMRRFTHVILTQDWHGEDHLSFASSHPGKKPLDSVLLPYGEQILWPDHCVEGTPGAEFHPNLKVAHCDLIIRKGFHREIDSYSAFFENDRQTPTGLAGYLRERGLTRIFIVGLATDFCVAYSALDARRLGFEVTVIEAGCRGIDVNGSLAAAWQQMQEAGVIRA